MFPEGIPITFSRPGISDAGFCFKFLNPTTEGRKIRKNYFHSTAIREIADPVIDALILWGHVVALYTQSSLTKDEDKLVAISAVAKRTAPWVQDEYLAGLWRKYLPYHLLWHVYSSTQYPSYLCVRPNSYVAPSWSWASVRGPCSLFARIDPGNQSSLIQILDTAVETKGPDRMGAVLGGKLRLSCWLKLVYLHSDWREGFSNEYYSLGEKRSLMATFDDKRLGTGDWYLMPILERRLPDRIAFDELLGLILIKMIA